MRSMRKENGPRRRLGLIDIDTVFVGNASDPFSTSEDRAIHGLNERIAGSHIEADQRTDRFVKKAGRNSEF